MPGCTIDSSASPEFQQLVKSWQRTHPQIDNDLQDAFSAISQNILAKKGRRVQAGPNLEVYKYRQNSHDIKRGSSYGWRIYALYDKSTGTMYPILIYPKTVWEDADNTTVHDAIRSIRIRLGYCMQSECNGKMTMFIPQEIYRGNDGDQVKLQCRNCRTVSWMEYNLATAFIQELV